MKHVLAGDLETYYHEFGPSEGPTAILLHGFPYDPCSYDDVGKILAQQGIRSIVPYLRGFGPTRFLSDETPRSGEQAGLGYDLLALMDALSIKQPVLAGYDWGGRAACIVAALWPDRVKGLLSCGVGYNIQDIKNASSPAPPEEEMRYWYMYYFHTERGRNALENNRREFCQHIWEIWSKNWAFDDETYDRSAASFDNPDFVEIVLHSYQHRFGGVPGDPKLSEIEQKLSAQPKISVPTIVLQGEDDGVDPPEKNDLVRDNFTGPYERIILSRVGHNPPQEAPDKFADLVMKLLKSD